jgi:FlaA1/EpsC-like NDP-sugar epimerase
MAAENRASAPNAIAATKTLIYGAGVAGQMLIRELRANADLPYEVLGFIDDDASKKQTRVQGVRVLGSGEELTSLVADLGIEMVLVAIPSASSLALASLFRRCQQTGVECKTIPGLSALVEGRALTAQVRDVALDDLLGRKPVRLDEESLRELLEGKVALVTGAAGSIGSELCRQIAKFKPEALIGYEIAESALFHLDAELSANFPSVRFMPVVGSIQNSARLAEIFQTHRPSLVFHAAAYKHVPMMEVHPFEAIENNVFGTYNVARIARKMGVERFVLISSDKAVRPTNIMGTTKRIAELIVQSMHSPGTKFVAVRFGNVLGSNGSVVPIFKEQIAKGGPVTVTHPEMTRYFMTIPEAAQLVLQGSSMAQGRETFVLDMGESVRIVDLARNLILLSGLQPGTDIEIKFSGTRPGEKLYEELCTDEENTVQTPHEKIRIFRGPEVDPSFVNCLANLERHCLTRNLTGLVAELRALVPEYSPSSQILETQAEQTARTSLLKLAEAVRLSPKQDGWTPAPLASPALSS